MNFIKQVLILLKSPFDRNYKIAFPVGLITTFVWGISVGMVGILIGMGGGSVSMFKIWIGVLVGGYVILIVVVAKALTKAQRSFYNLFFSLLFWGVLFILAWLLLVS